MNNLELISQTCHKLLYSTEEAKETKNYLDSRLSPRAQHKFGFGFFPFLDQLELLISLIGEEPLLSEELIIKNEDKIGYSFLSNHNLVIPYKDVYGHITALVGRTLLPEDQRQTKSIAKYKNTIFKKSKHLFGLFEAKQSIIKEDFAYVVEGQFDVIKANDHNIENIVALGSSNMSFFQLSLLLRYTNHIKLLLDNDEAGELGRTRILEKFGKYSTFSNCFVPSGFKDVDEFLSNIDINNSISFKKAVSP